MQKSIKYISSIGLSLMVILLATCGKEVTRIEPDADVNNPYDGINNGSDPTNPVIDSSSYLGLHTFIFSKKCAVPACHDGSFEPDFRTVEGSYNNLVYHTTLKNNANNDFTYRVLPGDTGLSWLHERITTDDMVLGKMPLYDYMPPHQVNKIEEWILDGAKNVYGVSPSQPNLQPSNGGVIAYINDTNGIRIDTARDQVISPMILPQSTNVQLWFLLYDTDASGEFIPGAYFTHNKIKISDHPYDFSNAFEDDLNVRLITDPIAILPISFGNGTQKAPYFHNYTINTSNYTPGRTYYFRVYVKDADHTFNTEIPENGSQFYLLTYFAFTVQ